MSNQLWQKFKIYENMYEAYLLRIAAVSLVLLVTVQIFLMNDQVRFFLNYSERLEGSPYIFEVEDYAESVGSLFIYEKCGMMTINIETGIDFTGESIRIVINGTPDFQREIRVYSTQTMWGTISLRRSDGN